ncbi:MAG TPA: ABC transporter permease [Vicinamibacterales bacterium]|jgi:predicted permease|nr:ABC transporter permease [Vicinamibacterales bacterium]
MDVIRQDLLSAWRMMRKDRAYTLAVILTLAICLGANTAIFTLVQSVLLRPLPYPETERLVNSFDSFPGAGVERAGTSVPNYFDRRAMKGVFEEVALYQFGGFRVGQGTAAEGVDALNVTPSFFQVLGVSATAGRLFREEEGTPGRNKVAILSHVFAARQPGGVTGIVGRQLRLNDELYDIVGVLPEGFHFLNPDIRVFVPIAFGPEDRAEDRRHSQNHEQIARLARGVTLDQAQAQVDALNAQIVERSGPLKAALIQAGYTTRMVPLEADLVRDVRAALLLLWGGVLFVVLIAAVNITNLSLVRASGRMKELATRSAIGAGRGRIARQLVTEATLLTVVGGVLGLLVGFWSLDALEWVGLSDLPRVHEVRMDSTVFGFTLGLALLLGLIVGAAPAVHLMRSSLSSILREEGRSGTAGRGARYVRRALVVSQVALAFVLLVGGGLLLASFQRLLRVDPGFVAEHLFTGRVRPLETRYRDDAALRSYVSRALERIRALPGVETAGATSFLPFSWDGNSSVVIPEGYVAAPGESVVSPNQLYVTPGYLEAMKVTLRRGRLFTGADGPDAPRVVIVDEQLAKRFWPNADPIGRRIYLPQRPEDVVKPGPDVTWLRVVGVVANVKLRGLVEGEQARVGAYYQSFMQNPSRNVGLAVRTRGELTAATTAVQRVLAEIDPEMQAFDVFSMSERVEKSLNPRRAPMLLSTAFGLLALLLASIGLYGILAYQVSQRAREIGIRLALGSDARGILLLVLNEGLSLVALGLAGGAAGAVALRGVIASQLYGVGALDPAVMLGAVAVLAVVSLVACLGPARRAARVSPLVALSQQ